MLTGIAATQPRYTPWEELCNVITHAIPLGFSLFKFLSYRSETDPTASDPTALSPGGKRFLLLGFSYLYATSTLYHGTVNPTYKSIFRCIDHFSVLVAMLALASPLILHGLRQIVAISVIAIMATLILSFVYFAFISWERFEGWELWLYIPFAGMCSALTGPGFMKLDRRATVRFLIGLLVYLVGIPFFVMDDLRYTHTVFHCAVAGGSYCHYRAVFG
jgi:hemolysin III